MSFPLGSPVQPVVDIQEARAISLRVFDGLVREYAELRMQREQLCQDLSAAENELSHDILEQRLRAASEELRATSQRVVATAMVMTGTRTFEACADMIESRG